MTWPDYMTGEDTRLVGFDSAPTWDDAAEVALTLSLPDGIPRLSYNDDGQDYYPTSFVTWEPKAPP
jgi:hypothetical protein